MCVCVCVCVRACVCVCVLTAAVEATATGSSLSTSALPSLGPFGPFGVGVGIRGGGAMGCMPSVLSSGLGDCVGPVPFMFGARDEVRADPLAAITSLGLLAPVASGSSSSISSGSISADTSSLSSDIQKLKLDR